MDPEDAAFKAKPAWMSKETAEAIPYPGASEPPVFDHELAELPPLEGDLPARGQGPSPGYKARWEKIGYYKAHGYTNNQIARHLGYSAASISRVLEQPFVQEVIERERAKFYSSEVADIIKDTAKESAIRFNKMIHDPSTSDKVIVELGKFHIEKQTGKAKQEISVEHGGLGGFMDMLRDMSHRGETIDVTPQAQPAALAAPAEPEMPAVPTTKDAAYWAAYIQGKR